MPGVDILVVSGRGTAGWRGSSGELAASFARAGATVQSVTTGPVPQVRTFALTDLVQAGAARRTCARAIEQYEPKAIVYCSVTAALLWPRPGAIWVDSMAAENRPGRHGVWQRTVERRRLQRAPLVLAMSERSLAPLNGQHAETVVVPVPVERSDGPASPLAEREFAAITYAGDPEKKRLEFVLSAWSQARRGDETMVVAGVDGIDSVEGVEVAGRVSRAEFRALLRRARTFVAAPRREDFGIAPLEALADGCLLVTTPAPGPYPALDLARRLDPRLVGESLATTLRIALDDPAPGYAERANQLLEPFSRAAVDRTIAERVLPRLLPGWTSA